MVLSQSDNFDAYQDNNGLREARSERGRIIGRLGVLGEVTERFLNASSAKKIELTLRTHQINGAR